MSDRELRELAAKAGIASQWQDQKGEMHEVAPETLRRLLAILGLPGDSIGELRDSLAEVEGHTALSASLLTTRLDAPLRLPRDRPGTRARLSFEDGSQRECMLGEGPAGEGILPGIEQAGYCGVECGGRQFSIAVAPRRAFGIGDVALGERMYGLAAQTYSLRRAGDGGTGDLGGVADLAAAAGRQGADALMLSPLHALFWADPTRFSPYSPSSRLFCNPLHAAPDRVLGAERVRRTIAESGLGDEFARLEALELIDWPMAARTKDRLLRALFDDVEHHDLGSVLGSDIAADLQRFRLNGGDLLLQHARFEVLYAARLREDPTALSWRSWPSAWRDPTDPAVTAFAAAERREVDFHIFLQWLADRSAAAAQEAARAVGMRIGLVGDLAIGMDGGGSYAWSRQNEVLVGATIGAPPDYYNANGQNWGLTSFSPRALIAGGFAPFIATLRAALRNAGGLRIDHVMGLLRLWLIPEGASPTEGAYVSYPVEDLFALIALETFRHRAVVIGEDLGTLPHGFRERLDGEGIAGMQVLRFERDHHGYFRAPDGWRPGAVAMTTTHDLAPTAGWWAEHDIEARAASQGFANEAEIAAERHLRAESRHFLWGALRHAEVATGDEPAPAVTDQVVDAATRYIAATPCGLAVLPLEDALGLVNQPNIPGTVDEHPNWRRRLPGTSAGLLDRPEVSPRLEAMRRRRSASAQGRG